MANMIRLNHRTSECPMFRQTEMWKTQLWNCEHCEAMEMICINAWCSVSKAADDSNYRKITQVTCRKWHNHDMMERSGSVATTFSWSSSWKPPSLRWRFAPLARFSRRRMLQTRTPWVYVNSKFRPCPKHRDFLQKMEGANTVNTIF